jgi:chromosome segregation ATPase
LKAKQLLHAELDEVQQQLEDVSMHKQHLEEQNHYLNRELNNLKSQMEEQERETDDILKKYQMHMQNYTIDANRFIDLNNQIDILTMENRMLKEKIREMEEKMMNYESSWVEKSHVNKLECRIRELEGKYELESTHKQRLMNQMERLKQQHESLMNEIEMVASREKKFEDNLKRSQRQNKELTEEMGDLKKKVVDLDETRKRLEQENEILEKELQSFKSEIKINQNRLEAFQNAFSSMNEDDEDEEEDDDDEMDDEDEELTSEQSGEHLDDIDEVYLNHQDIHSFNSSRKSLDNGHSFSTSISNAI